MSIKRLAILVNEFGTVGVDGDILKSCADDNCPVENIVELANGCICCTVADDFIPTIEALMAMTPSTVIFERIAGQSKALRSGFGRARPEVSPMPGSSYVWLR